MPGAFVDTDLVSMFVTSEFASTAVWTSADGSVNGRVIVDSMSQDVLEQVTVRDISVIYESVIWPTVAERDTISITNGVTNDYLVVRVERLADGRVHRAHLRVA